MKLCKHTITRILIFHFSFLIINCIPAHAQEIQWQNTIGGNSGDLLNSIKQTIDGGYILGGTSTSDISGNKTENSNGFNDYWIVKTDSLGNIQWQNTIGGSSIDFLYSIEQTSDGGYILGGYSSSNISGDKTENSQGFKDYWIVKTDSLGSIQWQNTIGGGGDDEVHSILQTSDGGYILGGYSDSDISGDKTENSQGGDDYWIVKTDSLGNIQWQNTIGGSSHDLLNSIAQTTDGGYILGGYSISLISGDKTEIGNGNYDYWMVKTDGLGNIQWQNSIGGSSNEVLYSISQTTDGGYIMGGTSTSNISGDKMENSNGGYDCWIVKTDFAGNIQWQNTIGGSSHDLLNSIVQTTDGGYILGGYSISPISGDKTEMGNGDYEYWILKTDSLGSIQWQNSIGGSSNDDLTSIQQTYDGGYILGGYSISDISGDKTENSQGGYDYWLLKLTDNFNSVVGKIYSDMNGNTMQDSGEPDLLHKKITEQSTGRFAFSEQNGRYSVSVLDSGNYTINAETVNYYNCFPLNHNIYFSGIQQIDSLNDFALQPQGTINDLCVTITPLGPFRSGFNASYMINYENVGTTVLNNVTTVFLKDNNLTYFTSNITPASVTADSVVWNIGTLTPFQSGSILVTVNVNLGLPIGTVINSGARILPVTGDANPACNTHFWEVQSTGSFDPNDILVNRDTLFTTEFPNPPYLDYIIRFQNTGNDTAFTVKILNPIDTTMLDLSTLEYVASSHPMDMSFIYHERNMRFQFDNILLPDSTINEPESHGFVRYRIKPKANLMLGDSIINFAAIYFDFNDPVITNTAVTEIVLPTSINEITDDQANLYLYPNPASDEITLSGYRVDNNAEIKVMDVLGNVVYSIIANTPSVIIPTKYFASGVYFVQCGSSNIKFVKK